MRPASLSMAALLAWLVLPTASAAAQTLPPAPAPAPPAAPTPAPDGWAHLDRALILLDQVLQQQLQPELWTDVAPTATEALDEVSQARGQGPSDELCLAARVTLQGALDNQRALERSASGQGDPNDLSAFAAVADDLEYVEGRLPQTSSLLIEVLFGLNRDDRAQQVLVHALARWPRNAQLHQQARDWAQALPAPEAVIDQLQRRVDVLGSADADYAGLALETIGLLRDALGRGEYGQGDYAPAAAHFEGAAKALQASRSMPRQLDEDAVNHLRAQSLTNAGWAYYGQAQGLWFASGDDDEQAAAAAAGAEQALTAALRAEPAFEDARQAVLSLGDLLLTHGQGGSVQDMAAIRDFYGRMAKRFDVADWWNNYAFFSRETGTARVAAGDAEQARQLFEQSYDAYQHAIQLEPDNARFVNDTGVILLYDLQRDPDKAEELFQRAWKLGKEVCDNPFVEQSVYDENFSAYTDAMLNLARLYLQQGKLDEAARMSDELLAVAPGRPDAQLTKKQIDAARENQG